MCLKHYEVSIAQSSLHAIADEFDAPFQGDSLSIWAAMEQGTHHKGEKELMQEVGADAAEKKREGSEDTLFSYTQYLCTSTTTAHSCLSQGTYNNSLHKSSPPSTRNLEGHTLSFLAASEGDHHKRDLGRGAGVKKRKVREDKPLLTFELVTQYYCMPIKQAAEALNVGLTHLKRRCRELGIPRWPHRQVKSLQRLIKNVQVLCFPYLQVARSLICFNI